MSEYLHAPDPAAPGDVHTFHIAAYNAAGDRVDFDWADLFELVLDKLGGSPCDVEDDE